MASAPRRASVFARLGPELSGPKGTAIVARTRCTTRARGDANREVEQQLAGIVGRSDDDVGVEFSEVRGEVAPAGWDRASA